MYNDNLRKFKSFISAAYRWRSDKTITETKTINDISEMFNLQFPLDRIEDFEIVKFSAQEYSIEIRDKKTGYIYKSEYSCSSDLLGTHSFSTNPGDLKFVNTTVIYSPEITLHSTGSIGKKDSIKSKIILRDGTDEIIVTIEEPHQSLIFNYLSKSVSIALANIKQSGDNVCREKVLYQKNFAKNKDFTYSHVKADRGCTLDNYQCVFPDNLIYGTEGNRVDASGKNINGYMIQNNNIPADILRNRILATRYCEDKSLDQRLANKTGYIKLSGYLEAKAKENHHLIVSKSLTGIYINYRKEKYNKERLTNDITFNDSVFCDTRGETEEDNNREFTIADILYVIIELKDRYPNNEFIDMAIIELQEFIRRIKESKGMIEKVPSLSDPSLYIDLPVSKVVDVLIETKDELFKELLEESNLIQTKTNSLIKSA